MSGILIVAALGLIAAAAVAYPLFAGAGRYQDAASLETDLARYRAALAAGTVCPRCRLANEAGSRFCGECGTELTTSG